MFRTLFALCLLALLALPAAAVDMPLTLDGMSVVTGPYWENHEPASLSVSARLPIRNADKAAAPAIAFAANRFSVERAWSKPLKGIPEDALCVVAFGAGMAVNQGALYCTLKGVTAWPNSVTTELALKARLGTGFAFGGHGKYHVAACWKPAEAIKFEGKPGWLVGGILWEN